MANTFKAQEGDTGHAPHFLTGLSAAGSALRGSISSNYFGIVGRLLERHVLPAALADQPNAALGRSLDRDCQLYLMDVCNVDLNGEDMGHLHRIGVVPFLNALLAFTGAKKPKGDRTRQAAFV